MLFQPAFQTEIRRSWWMEQVFSLCVVYSTHKHTQSSTVHVHATGILFDCICSWYVPVHVTWTSRVAWSHSGWSAGRHWHWSELLGLSKHLLCPIYCQPTHRDVSQSVQIRHQSVCSCEWLWEALQSPYTIITLQQQHTKLYRFSNLSTTVIVF